MSSTTFRLARFEVHDREGLEFPRRALHERRGERGVDLHRLPTPDGAGVGDRDLDADVAVLADRRDYCGVVREGRVREAVPEGERHVERPGVVPAVADQDAFAVPDVPELAGEAPERRGVLQTQRDGLGELAAGIDLAEQHVGRRRATRLAQQPALEDRGNVAGEWQRDHAAVREHDHCAGVGPPHGFQERQLRVGQVDPCAVVALRLVLRGQAEEHHRDVGRGSRRGRLLDQFRGIPGAVEGESGAKRTSPPAASTIAVSASSSRVVMICEEPAPWKRGVRANSPITATDCEGCSGRTGPAPERGSFFSSTIERAAASLARA